MDNLRKNKIQSLIEQRTGFRIVIVVLVCLMAISLFALLKDKNKVPQLPPSNMIGNPASTVAPSLNPESLKAQRCTYNGQSYAPGDIAKIDQVWIRCTTTIVFAPDRPVTPVYGSVVWTQVQ